MAKQTKMFYEMSKNATKCVNRNIKGLFGHSDHGPTLGSWTTQISWSGRRIKKVNFRFSLET